jgi:hypothetical protein
VEPPWRLLRRLNLGREEYCQRLLTMLILEAAYPRWNTHSRPSRRGVEFLRALDRLCFGSTDLGEEPTFVDEFELVRRHEAESGGAPDYAVLDGSRLWLVELKTEVGSHRAGQLPLYVELAGHHHPNLTLDITYLTPPMSPATLEMPGPDRFAHVTWDQALPIALDLWGADTGEAGQIVDALREALAGLGEHWAAWRDRHLANPLTLAVGLAARTAEDGKQRALDFEAASLEELQGLRVEARDALIADPPHGRAVMPWLWNVQSTDGKPLTEAGRQTGYEMRFSASRDVQQLS